MPPTPFEFSAWQCAKVGAGAVPVRTSEGRLPICHGAITACNGLRYPMGAALLDIDHPSRVLLRPQSCLPAPAAPCELAGDTPDVVFPCAALTQGDRIAIYYGAADTCVALAFGHISEILRFLKS